MQYPWTKIFHSILPDITIIGAFFTLAALGVELLIPGVFSLQKILFAAITITLVSSILYKKDIQREDQKEAIKQYKEGEEKNNTNTATLYSLILKGLLSLGGIVLILIATQGFPLLAQCTLFAMCIGIAILFTHNN